MKKTSILLVEDHAIVREGLRNLLSLDDGFTIVGEAATGRDAVEMVRTLTPDVVLMDGAMPDLNGFEATRQILLAAPGTRILALSAHSDDEYVLRMIEVGALGYLAKQASGQMLIRAIREVAAGRPYFSEAIARRRLSADRRAHERGGTHAVPKRELTCREAEVLQLVAEGSANKQIAAELHISIKTVEKHRQQLMDKLDIHDTAGLTRHAIATGAVESSTQSTGE